MSDEINFELAWEFLTSVINNGKTEIKVSALPNSLQKIAKVIGYTDEDTVPLLSLKEYLEKTWENISAVETETENFHVSKSFQDPSETIKPEISTFPTNGNDQNSEENSGRNSPFLPQSVKNSFLKLFIFQKLLNQSINNVLKSNIPLEYSTPLPFKLNKLLLILRSYRHKFCPRHLYHQVNVNRLSIINVCLTAKRPKSLNLNLLNNLTVKQLKG